MQQNLDLFSKKLYTCLTIKAGQSVYGKDICSWATMRKQRGGPVKLFEIFTISKEQNMFRIKQNSTIYRHLWGQHR